MFPELMGCLPMASGSAGTAMPEHQSAAVITMRKSTKLPIASVVRTTEKRYPNGRIVAGDHRSGHENNTPSSELVGLPTDGMDINDDDDFGTRRVAGCRRGS